MRLPDSFSSSQEEAEDKGQAGEEGPSHPGVPDAESAALNLQGLTEGGAAGPESDSGMSGTPYASPARRASGRVTPKRRPCHGCGELGHAWKICPTTGLDAPCPLCQDEERLDRPCPRCGRSDQRRHWGWQERRVEDDIDRFERMVDAEAEAQAPEASAVLDGRWKSGCPKGRQQDPREEAPGPGPGPPWGPGRPGSTR